MNFLAHAHLSGDNNDILFGNFIADSVKGNSYNRYRKDIATGILLHREIDSFTDGHPITKRSREQVRNHFGKFSGIVVDIYYDHFLARNWQNYCNTELSVFTSEIYRIISRRFLLMPPRVKRILPFMIGQNWLTGYANLNDLARVFRGMDRRTNHISGMDNAIYVLKENYNQINEDFEEFYPLLEEYSKNVLANLTNG